MNKLLLFIITAFLIRLTLMSITFHSDLLAFHYSNFAFADSFVLNIYDYLHNLPKDSIIRLYGTDFFTWPPLTYFLLGSLTFVLKPFFNSEFARNLTPDGLYTSSEIFRHLFLLKLPYILFDVLSAFFIFKLFEKENERKLALILWLFNPVLLYSTYMIGQFDLIPTFFVILAVLLAQKGRNALSLVSLGFGGALKVFPLFLVPFAAVILGRKTSEKLSLFSLGLLPFIISIIPFIPSSAFRSVSLFSVQSQKFLYAGINVSGADTLYLFLIFYLLLFFLAFGFFGQTDLLWKYFFAVFLLFFSLTNYHPQWFLWLTPFLIFWIVKQPNKWIWALIIFLLFVGVTFLFESSLSIGLFSPVLPQVRDFPGVSSFVGRFLPTTQVASILRSIFAAISAWTILNMFWSERKSQKNLVNG